jgi:type II secretory pathway pseudopilin PulG
VELLLVVTILAILMGLVLPVLGGLRTKSRAIRCVNNLKQMQLAQLAYSTDWDDFFPPNRLGEFVPRGQTWVNGWVVPTSPDSTNRNLLRNSLLARYGAVDALWRCPGDDSRATINGNSFDRVRSISMNYYLGATLTVPNRQIYRKVTDLVVPSPSDAMVLTDERSDTINDGAFVLESNFQVRRPNEWHLVDFPGNFHGTGTGISFADGRAEIHIWQDPRTLTVVHPFQVLKGDQDVLWLDSHSSAPTGSR